MVGQRQVAASVSNYCQDILQPRSSGVGEGGGGGGRGVGREGGGEGEERGGERGDGQARLLAGMLVMSILPSVAWGEIKFLGGGE